MKESDRFQNIIQKEVVIIMTDSKFKAPSLHFNGEKD